MQKKQYEASQILNPHKESTHGTHACVRRQLRTRQKENQTEKTSIKYTHGILRWHLKRNRYKLVVDTQREDDFQREKQKGGTLIRRC